MSDLDVEATASISVAYTARFSLRLELATVTLAPASVLVTVQLRVADTSAAATLKSTIDSMSAAEHRSLLNDTGLAVSVLSVEPSTIYDLSAAPRDPPLVTPTEVRRPPLPFLPALNPSPPTPAPSPAPPVSSPAPPAQSPPQVASIEGQTSSPPSPQVALIEVQPLNALSSEGARSSGGLVGIAAALLAACVCVGFICVFRRRRQQQQRANVQRSAAPPPDEMKPGSADCAHTEAAEGVLKRRCSFGRGLNRGSLHLKSKRSTEAVDVISRDAVSAAAVAQMDESKQALKQANLELSQIVQDSEAEEAELREELARLQLEDADLSEELRQVQQDSEQLMCEEEVDDALQELQEAKSELFQASREQETEQAEAMEELGRLSDDLEHLQFEIEMEAEMVRESQELSCSSHAQGDDGDASSGGAGDDGQLGATSIDADSIDDNEMDGDGCVRQRGSRSGRMGRRRQAEQDRWRVHVSKFYETLEAGRMRKAELVQRCAEESAAIQEEMTMQQRALRVVVEQLARERERWDLLADADLSTVRAKAETVQKERVEQARRQVAAKVGQAREAVECAREERKMRRGHWEMAVEATSDEVDVLELRVHDVANQIDTLKFRSSSAVRNAVNTFNALSVAAERGQVDIHHTRNSRTMSKPGSHCEPNGNVSNSVVALRKRVQSSAEKRRTGAHLADKSTYSLPQPMLLPQPSNMAKKHGSGELRGVPPSCIRAKTDS
uniref:Uncharacterized protein n=1 Tax=Haptolina ericina TaxID=156174 RepID=A0A7S3EUK0_9EUKA